ncbi:hypothetical protein NPIL_460261 [Nephila pilipes]|uniref:Uncharacterized protein n=1 Tax=Nephila pilipes TaxID=299642 RepID=A0A8X6N360_NEPPI|nr:hypothetical protein NPIL_460261 [Nephila pilipes]
MTIPSPEYMFARDVIRYILCEYFPGVIWIPTGIFVHQNHDSPFNTRVKEAIESYLDEFGICVFEKYEKRFPEKNPSAQQHCEYCEEQIKIPCAPRDVVVKFVAVCLDLSLITTLSVLCGVMEAPHVTHGLIVRYFETLKSRGFIADTCWEELQDMCVNEKK